jgi:hypothetical protein
MPGIDSKWLCEGYRGRILLADLSEQPGRVRLPLSDVLLSDIRSSESRSGQSRNDDSNMACEGYPAGFCQSGLQITASFFVLLWPYLFEYLSDRSLSLHSVPQRKNVLAQILVKSSQTTEKSESGSAQKKAIPLQINLSIHQKRARAIQFQDLHQ